MGQIYRNLIEVLIWLGCIADTLRGLEVYHSFVKMSWLIQPFIFIRKSNEELALNLMSKPLQNSSNSHIDEG